MKEPIIEIQDLSKSYLLNHEPKSGTGYTLKELFSDRIRSFLPGKKLAIPGTNDKGGRRWKQEFKALDGINLNVYEGQRIGIIGRNGAGKSTLLKILSRITEPSSGRVTIEGRVSSLLEVGTGFHPELTGKENIFLNGAILGMSKAEIRSKYDEIVDFSEVEKFIDTPVKWYSSGMYIRLAFAVSAHLEPDILVVDEVLAVGDIKFQKKCLGKMEEVSQKQGRTILFVSHNMDAIRAICGRAILLDQGRLIKDANVQDTIATYMEGEELQHQSVYEVSESKPAITNVSVNKDLLELGVLELTIGYSSPYQLRAVPGFVVFNQANVPIMGSNTRYHSPLEEVPMQKTGSFKAVIKNLELHTGYYKVSVWLGNFDADYDHRTDCVLFFYQNQHAYTNVPDPLFAGAIDKNCEWRYYQT